MDKDIWALEQQEQELHLQELARRLAPIWACVCSLPADAPERQH